MNRIALFLLLPVAAVACRDQGPTAPEDGPQFAVAASRPVYQVVGGGSVVREDIPGSPREIYGFTAQVDAQGRVRGEAEVHFPSDNVNMHIDVQCLAIQYNQAWMSGPVTRSDDPLTPVGRVFFWQVRDNGEGQGATPDRISNFIHRPADNYAPDVCKWKYPLTMFPWDNGNVRIMTNNGLGLADLVGSWDATVFLYVSLANPADTADAIAAGVNVRTTIAPDGRTTNVFWTPDAIVESGRARFDVVNGEVLVTADAGGPVLETLHVRRSGNMFTLEGDVPDGPDFNQDGQDDPSHVFMVVRMKRTGTLIGDLAGTWDATQWRYISEPARMDTVNLLGRGVAVSFAIGLDGRYTLTASPGGTQLGELLVEGSTLLTRNRSGSIARAYTFALNKNSLSFAGPDRFDFDGNPATPDTLATLEAVLVRR
jgi:hypothetical protein